MRRIRITALLLALLFLLTVCGGCGKAGPAEMKEPVYTGLEVNGKPRFDLSWSRVAGVKSYALAIYVELADFTDRQEIPVRGTEKTVTLLQGVYTDTATYRMKVRPEGEKDAPWSQVWQIDFVDGVYTVTGSAPDFDGAEPAPKPANKTEAAPKETKAPAEHAYPEDISTFLAKEAGSDKPDLTKAALLTVYVNRCEYGEPTQYIADPQVIAAAAKAVSEVTVTGGPDGISSTGDHTSYVFGDGAGKTLASFSIQDGMLMEDDGRYPLTGLEALLAVEGVMLAGDWDAYWSEESDKARAYEEGFQAVYPGSPFAFSGYYASLAEEAGKALLESVHIYVSWNEEAGELVSTDPAVIGAVYDALSRVKVEKAAEDSPQGQKWFVTFRWTPAGSTLARQATLTFQGDRLLSDMEGLEDGLILTDLAGLFDAADAEVLTYIKEKGNTKKPKPVY